MSVHTFIWAFTPSYERSHYHTINPHNIIWATVSENFRKRTFGHVRPAKIQSSLRILGIWSHSSMSLVWIVKVAKFCHADNEDLDQTARMRRLIWVYVGLVCQKVCFPTFRHIIAIIGALFNAALLTEGHIQGWLLTVGLSFFFSFFLFFLSS